VLASLKRFAAHWVIIFFVSLILLPALMIGAHYVKKLLLWIDVDPVEREVFNFVSLYLTVADVVLIFGTAGIGVYKLLESEVER
jgi:hypothetical protein